MDGDVFAGAVVLVGFFFFEVCFGGGGGAGKKVEEDGEGAFERFVDRCGFFVVVGVGFGGGCFFFFVVGFEAGPELCGCVGNGAGGCFVVGWEVAVEDVGVEGEREGGGEDGCGGDENDGDCIFKGGIESADDGDVVGVEVEVDG